MFEKYIENRNQAALMAFFLVNPERAFFVGELQKRLGSKNLTTNLNQFVKEGMLSTFVKKGKRYYRANKKHPIFAELKPAARKLPQYEDELVAYLKKMPGLKMALLRGLFVGQPHMECDIFLVGKIPPQKIEQFEKGLKKLMGQEVNYAVFSTEEYNYRKYIFDHFMKDVLENDHLILFNTLRQ